MTKIRKFVFLCFLVSQETCSSEMFQLIDASPLKPKGFLDQKRN